MPLPPIPSLANFLAKRPSFSATSAATRRIFTSPEAIPKFAGLRAGDDRHAFCRLLTNEHFARSCVQGSRHRTGQIDQLSPAPCFSYSLALCTWKHARECLTLGHRREMVRILTIAHGNTRNAALPSGEACRLAPRRMGPPYVPGRACSETEQPPFYAELPLTPYTPTTPVSRGSVALLERPRPKFRARNLACPRRRRERGFASADACLRPAAVRPWSGRRGRPTRLLRPMLPLSDTIHTMRGEPLPETSIVTAFQRLELQDGTLGLDVVGKVWGFVGRASENQRFVTRLSARL